jgi:hypothetical protein
MAQPIRILRSRCAFPAHPSFIRLTFLQGELEHRTPKARYTRTSRKNFIKQITQIERRQTRIRRIRDRLRQTKNVGNEEVASSPDAHHHIGKSENNPEHIGRFLQEHADDPATKVTDNYHLIAPVKSSHCNMYALFVPRISYQN